ncbi:Peptide chain release factor 1 [Frankliniella fusca]|uniref:Peptide chain release factor 1 n=1 Tax=Frankliniella fusca TaxID=407009 RepID=A0AAE1H3K3_9NEOP|nr:Peptide chain release factor 1 [Frankliniella fusca]
MDSKWNCPVVKKDSPVVKKDSPWAEGAFTGSPGCNCGTLSNHKGSMMASHNIKEFIFWSDNCGGQNKNKFLFSMYSYASAKFKIKITHRYMERGHTMNEADSMHATIERASKGSQIYDPDDWIKIIKEAKVEGKSVKNFHILADTHQNWKQKNAKWKSVREFLVDSSDPNQIKLKHDLSVNSDETVFRVSKKAFERPIAFPTKKLKDLASLCNELVIPSAKQAFYKNLLNFPVLTNPLLNEPEDQEENSETEDENAHAQDFTWSEDSDESDFEEEARRLRRSKRNQIEESDEDVDGDLIDSD